MAASMLPAVGAPVLVALALGATPSPPAEATVFIRVVGDVVAEYVRGWKQEKADREVAIGTGSGFILAPSGYVLTNHHVVSGGEFTIPSGGPDLPEVRVRLEVRRIEVVLPAGEAGPERIFEATLTAEDPEADLALLSVSATDLPWLPLGDSDALDLGQPVTAWGFPLGTRTEVGRQRRRLDTPGVAASPGSVAALRADDEGEARYIQTDVSLNSGNSGGPLVDEDGFVVGIVRMKLRQAERVGFAIPVNHAKDLLEGQMASLLPARLHLGPPQAFDWKGLRLRVPESMGDTSRSRLRWDSGDAEDDVSLVIDRVASPWSPAALQAHLLAGGFGGKAFAALPRPPGRERFGAGRDADAAIEYAVLDLGPEKVVARFAGPTLAVAYNRAVLRRSLESLEADPLLTAEVRRPVAAAAERVSFPHPRAPSAVLPTGWTREGAAGATPPILAEADDGLSASPEGDFTITCRTLWWQATRVTPEQAAEARAARNGKSTPPTKTGEYRLREDRLGVAYEVQGLFVRAGPGLVQLEVRAPVAKAAFVTGTLATMRQAFDPQ